MRILKIVKSEYSSVLGKCKNKRIIYFSYKKLIVNLLQPQKRTTLIDGHRDVRKYEQSTLTDGRIRKYKRTDGQMDEMMTATNAIGEFY